MSTVTYDRMKDMGMSQVDMIFALRKRGIKIQPPELSVFLRGVATNPKSVWILKECDNILNDIERSGF